MSPPFTDLVDSQEWEQVKKPSNLLASNIRFFTAHSGQQQIASQVPKHNSYSFWGMLLKAMDTHSKRRRLCPYKGLNREERHQVMRLPDCSLTALSCRICRFIIFKMFLTGKTSGRSKALFIGVSDLGSLVISSSFVGKMRK